MQLKIILAKIIRHSLFWTKIFPIKNNKIIFFSYQGKNYSCNPKYIAERLAYDKEADNLKILYAFLDTDKYIGKLPANIEIIKYGSLSFFYHYFTAKIIITNSSNLPYLPKKKKQLLINTWHGGGAYKTELYDLDLTHFKNENVDYFISSSTVFHKLLKSSTGLSDSKFLDVGMPRNDFLIHYTPVQISKIKSKMRLEHNVNYLLFAPTYREKGRKIIYPDFEKILKVFSQRFSGRWKLILRAHYDCKNEFLDMGLDYIDLSSFDDMQEVLAVSDAVITDYSSLIWDYSFLKKPCFLYTPDLELYEAERGFYYPLPTWGFPYAPDMDGLCKSIIDFDQEEFCKKMEEHHKNLGSYEHGNATEKVVAVILDSIKRG